MTITKVSAQTGGLHRLERKRQQGLRYFYFPCPLHSPNEGPFQQNGLEHYEVASDSKEMAEDGLLRAGSCTTGLKKRQIKKFRLRGLESASSLRGHVCVGYF